jgi:hypothetical protein
MASTIQIKNSNTSGNSPSSLTQGELAINVNDGNLFYGDGTSVKQDFVLGSVSASGGFTGSIDASGIDGTIDISDQTNLAGGTNLTLSGDTMNLDADISLTSITASGDISASGDLISNTLTAAGIAYPTTDGDNGDVLITDGAGNLSFARTTVYANVKNVHGSELVKGMPVHVTGAAGNTSEVVAASASNAATMPAHFILNETLADDEEGLAIAVGYINQVNTGDFSEGDTVYVGADGGYTNVKPTGSNLIQNLGIVDKVDASNGSGFILGAGRSNDVPNITSGYAWVGNSDQVATAVATSSFVVTNANTASYVAADNIAQPFSTLEVDGPSNSHIEVGTYNVGFDQISIPTTQITGSGLIISGAMADQDHHNFLKIGEIELVDVNTLLNSNTFLIHNVDDFLLTSGSDGGNITTANLLFRHQGNAFDIYQNGSSKISMNSGGDLSFNGNNITFTPGSGDTNIQAVNTTATNTYIITAEGNPNNIPQSLRSINAQDFFRTVNGAVTASAVSSSGIITADSFVGTVTTAETASYVAASNIDGTIDISDQTNLAGGTNLTLSDDTMNLDASISLTSITTSGNVSSSGTITANTIEVDTDIDITTNNEFLRGKTTGGVTRNLIGFDASNVVVVGNTSVDSIQLNNDTSVNGNLTLEGQFIIDEAKFKVGKTLSSAGDGNGTIIKEGNTTTTAGKIYYYTSLGEWTLTDADAESSSTGLLGVALGTNSGTNGMLLQGCVTLATDPGDTGDILYLQTDTAGDTGDATSTAPNGTNDIVRIIGYCLDSAKIYFNPSNDFIKHT